MHKLNVRLARKWGKTLNHKNASWILPDGSFVGGVCFPTHEQMILSLFKRENSMIFSEFINESGALRCSEEREMLSITVGKSLTADQEHAICSWPDVNKIFVDVVLLDDNGEHYKDIGIWTKDRVEGLFDKIRGIFGG